jgi:hypothetical protein
MQNGIAWFEHHVAELGSPPHPTPRAHLHRGQPKHLEPTPALLVAPQQRLQQAGGVGVGGALHGHHVRLNQHVRRPPRVRARARARAGGALGARRQRGAPLALVVAAPVVGAQRQDGLAAEGGKHHAGALRELAQLDHALRLQRADDLLGLRGEEAAQGDGRAGAQFAGVVVQRLPRRLQDRGANSWQAIMKMACAAERIAAPGPLTCSSSSSAAISGEALRSAIATTLIESKFSQMLYVLLRSLLPDCLIVL